MITDKDRERFENDYCWHILVDEEDREEVWQFITTLVSEKVKEARIDENIRIKQILLRRNKQLEGEE